MSTFVDIMADIVQDVRDEYDPTNDKKPFYLYGHPLDIFNILAAKSKHSTLKYDKYPLIALFQDFEEDTEVKGDPGLDVSVTGITLVIATETKENYHAPDRYTNTFTPILQPLYELLMKQIKRSKLVYSDDFYQHTKIDRLYWGKSDEFGSTANKTNDKLDAIVITGLTLGVVSC